jgi:signal transduction histidine kinase
LVLQNVAPAELAAAAVRRAPKVTSTVSDLLGTLRGKRWLTGFGGDLLALFVAVLDVWLVIPRDAEPYQIIASGVACSAMLMRRWVPFLAVLVAVPGFLFGWSELAAMIAMATLAWKHAWTWRTWIGFALIWSCREVIWPWQEFLATGWRGHILDGIWGVIVAGMPIAIGLLIIARTELSAQIAELAATRERENRLHAHAVRESERAKLAREMHDVVSHQVTLIAMQAGAMQVAPPDEANQIAETIRSLSTKTLDELRELVGLLRSGAFDDESAHPGLDQVAQLVRTSDVKVTLRMDTDPQRLPGPVSGAAYRTVQEALTNVRKHATGAKTNVWIRIDDDQLAIDVTNTKARTGRKVDLPSGGHGLMGMRERAGLLGGTFDAHTTSDGGFELRARYPLAS